MHDTCSGSRKETQRDGFFSRLVSGRYAFPVLLGTVAAASVVLPGLGAGPRMAAGPAALPTMGIIGLCIVAGICILAGALIIMRRG